MEGAASTPAAGAGTAPFPGVRVSNHPVLLHKLSLIRRRSSTAREFRALFREMSFYLGYEATQGLGTKEVQVLNAAGDCVVCTGRKIAERVAVVPVLRGGLAMSDALLDLLPNAPVYHIGMYRNPASQIPIQYYNRLPKGRAADVAIVLDPVIASSRSISAVVSILKTWGAKRVVVISLVASRCGLEALMALHPDITVLCAAVDELADDGVTLVPGIGDAGDRLYLGPDTADEGDETMQSPRGTKKAKA